MLDPFLSLEPYRLRPLLGHASVLEGIHEISLWRRRLTFERMSVQGRLTCGDPFQDSGVVGLPAFRNQDKKNAWTDLIRTSIPEEYDLMTSWHTFWSILRVKMNSK